MVTRLPDLRAMGEAPSMRSGRRVAVYDGTPASQGAMEGAQHSAAGARMEFEARGNMGRAEVAGLEAIADAGEIRMKGKIAIGEAIKNLGEGVGRLGGGISRMVERQQAEADRERGKNARLEASRAETQFLVDRIKFDSEFEKNNPDFNTWGAAYPAGLEELRQKAMGVIADPEARTYFDLKTQPDVARGTAAILTRAETRGKELGLGELEKNLFDLREEGLKAPDDKTRADVILAGRNRIQDAVRKGYLTPERGFEISQRWVVDYADKSLRLVPPRERIPALEGALSGDAVDRTMELLRRKEQFRSTTYPDMTYRNGEYVNSGYRLGYGSDTITDANGTIRQVRQGDVVSKEDAERDLRRRSMESLGQVNRVAAAAGVELTANQQAALASVTYNYGTLPSSVESAIRTKDPEAIASAIEGLQNHNKGINRSRRLQEAQLARTPDGAGNRATTIASFLPTDRRQAMLDSAKREYEQELNAADREQQREVQTAVTGVKALIESDLASMERSGKGIVETQEENLNPALVERVLGREAALEWHIKRERARNVWGALEGIELLSEEQVRQRVAKLEPNPGSATYADDMQAYDRARQKAATYLKARESDPALAVEVFPVVKAVREQIEAEGGKMDAAKWERLMGARKKALEAAQVPEPLLLTKKEAAGIVARLRDIGESNPRGMAGLMEELHATYGSMAKDALEAGLAHNQVDRDIRLAAREVLGKIMQRQIPNISEVRRLDQAADQAQLNGAMAGKPLAQRRPAATEGWQTPGGAGAKIKSGPMKPSDVPSVLANNRKIIEGTDFLAGIPREDLKQLWQHRHDPEVLQEFENLHGKGTAKRALQEDARRRGVNLEQEAAELKKKPRRVSMSPRGPDGSRTFTVD